MSSDLQLAPSGAETDFFCVKYQVWYPLEDCNYRVAHATYHGCVDCFQGRVNLRAARNGRRTPCTTNAQLIPFPQLPADEEKKADTGK
jgi:hypothetical protein